MTPLPITKFVVAYLLLGFLAVLFDLAFDPEGRRAVTKMFWEFVFYLLLVLAWPVVLFQAIKRAWRKKRDL